MKTIEEIANSTGSGMTDREKAICLLAWLKSSPTNAAKLCELSGISKEVAIQAALDIRTFIKESF